MPYIQVDNNLPGVRALLAFSPKTASAIGTLTNLLLQTDEGISRAERELIGMYVSHLNDCFYCQTSHGAIAACYLGGNDELVAQVKKDFHKAAISEKLKALLTIAASVQRSGLAVTAEEVSAARTAGASDKEIHDTVLIAALFCMMNRYVDGLAAESPTDFSTYPVRARQIVEHGYGDHVFNSPQPI